MAIEWTIKKFDQLNVDQLYALLRLRNEIFVVEQNCVFQDADNKDQYSFHCQGISGDELVAYARIVPPGATYEQVSIGRVATAQKARGEGLGRRLIDECIRFIRQEYGEVSIKIGAQAHLMKFYQSFGFAQSGDKYLEDGIDHVHMIRPFPAHQP